MQYLVFSLWNSDSLPPFFPSYLPSEVRVGALLLCSPSLGELIGNLTIPVPSCSFPWCLWILRLTLVFSVLSQRPQLEKVRKEGGDGGSWGSGGWLSLENIFSGFPVGCLGSPNSFTPHFHPYSPRTPASVTWPNLFILALGILPLFTTYTLVQYIFRPLIFVVYWNCFRFLSSDNASGLQLTG